MYLLIKIEVIREGVIAHIVSRYDDDETANVKRDEIESYEDNENVMYIVMEYHNA